MILVNPIIYKFGLEKARIGIFVLIFFLGFLASLVSNLIDFKPLLQYLDIFNHFWILPIFTIILLYISYKISTKVYQKKEF